MYHFATPEDLRIAGAHNLAIGAADIHDMKAAILEMIHLHVSTSQFVQLPCICIT